MSEFVRGALFTGGLILFGKGMYRLGKMKARKEELKHWKEFQEEAEKMFAEMDKKKEGTS
jgi:hypothetical protein